MQLNIKNGEAHALATNLAALTGQSMTAAVMTALRESLDRLKPQESREDQVQRKTEELLAIGRECAARMKEPWRSVDHGELLYDENGLPK